MELGSTAAGVIALLSDRIDVAATCPDALIVSETGLKIVAGLVDRPPTSIVAVSAIGTAREIRGRRVGTTAPWGSVSIFFRAVLRAHGLERGDYTEIVCGPTPAQVAALERGDIDAAMLTAPFDERTVSRGFRLIADVGAELGPCAFTTLNVRDGWTADERWVAFRKDLAGAIPRVSSTIRYDLRVSGLQRLLEFMESDGIRVTRSVAELVE